MSAVSIEAEVDLEDLAEGLGRSARGIFGVSESDLIEFVLTLDGYVADLSFTKELHKGLGEVIDLEEGRL